MRKGTVSAPSETMRSTEAKLLQKYEQPWANGNVLNQKNWNDCLTFVLTGGVNFHNTFEVGKFGAELGGGSSKILFTHNQLHSISGYNERNATAHLRYEFPPFSEDHRMRCQTPHFSWREGRITQDKNDLTPPRKAFPRLPHPDHFQSDATPPTDRLSSGLSDEPRNGAIRRILCFHRQG